MIHIIPPNDLKPHVKHPDCDCKPKLITENGRVIVVHNAWDRRELKEELMETNDN